MTRHRKKYIAYTDGSCDNMNPLRPGGSAYIILDTKHNLVKKSSKGFINTTNNRMELLAIISVVNSLPDYSHVVINTDSQYCILALQSKCPKCNLDQIALFHRLREEKHIAVELQWVKGHSDDIYNNMCDSMANEQYQRILGEYPESSTRFKFKDLKPEKVKPKKEKHERSNRKSRKRNSKV